MHTKIEFVYCLLDLSQTKLSVGDILELLNLSHDILCLHMYKPRHRDFLGQQQQGMAKSKPTKHMDIYMLSHVRSLNEITIHLM